MPPGRHKREQKKKKKGKDKKFIGEDSVKKKQQN